MAIWTLPDGFVRAHSWAQPDERKKLQRAEFTGYTRELINGPSDRWICSAEIRPMSEAELISWRAFQARMRQPGALARVPATTGSQIVPGGGLPETAVVSSGVAVGQALPLSGLVAGATHLLAGQLLTVTLPGGDEQMFALLQDLVADGSGAAVAALASPLRRTPLLGAMVELAEPWALMRATDPLAWSQEPGAVFAARTIEFEEGF